MAQVKYVTDRLNLVEFRITEMKTKKARCNEGLQIGTPAGMKTSLKYVGEKNVDQCYEQDM